MIGVDAGNPLFSKNGHYPPESAQIINATAVAEIYAMLGLDAVAVGLNDLSGGLDFLRKTAELGLPWVSANLHDNEGALIFPPYISKNIDNLSVAIIGITGPSHSDADDFEIKDGAEALADLLPELEEGFDFIILLSGLPLAETAALIDQPSPVDVAITADNAKENIAPFFSNTTLITQTGNRGRYQGVLSMNWNGSPLGVNTSDKLMNLRKRFKSINLQLHRLQTNPWDASSKAEKIRELKEQRDGLIEQIEDLERELESGDYRNDVSTYEYRFIPLSNSGRIDPQIDYLIKDAKKRKSAARTK